MVLQKYKNFTEMTSNMIYIVAFGVGLKCPFEHTVPFPVDNFLLLSVDKLQIKVIPYPLQIADVLNGRSYTISIPLI